MHTNSPSSPSWKLELPSPRWVAATILFFFILSGLRVLTSRIPVFNDEAIYFDMIMNATEGRGFTTTLFKDYIPLVDQYFFWYPPVYFLVLEKIYAVFGSSLMVGRAFSLLCVTLSISLLYLLSARWLRSEWARVAVLFLLTVDPYVLDAAGTSRMESLVAVLGLTAVWLHVRWLESRAPLYAVLSGTAAALSILTHPTGIIFLIPLGLSSLTASRSTLKQRIWQTVLFSLPVVLGFGLWAVTFLPHWDVFYLQNLVQFHRKEFGEYFMWLSILYKPWHRVILLSYLASAVFFVFRCVKQKLYLNELNRLLLLLVLTSTVLSFSLKEMWYLVFFPLGSIMALVSNLEFLAGTKKRWLVVTALPLVIAGIGITTIINLDSLQKQSYRQFAAPLSEHLPQGATVLLSSHPTPYFYFRDARPDLQLTEVPNAPSNEPIDLAVYNKILSSVEYVVTSYMVSEHVAEYIRNNLEDITYRSTTFTQGHEVIVIKLKPAAERTPLERSPELQWTYPQL